MPRRRPSQCSRAGFTFIELILALAIFSLVATMSGGIFWSITKAWNRGGEMLEQLQYGDFAMEQLVTALRGAAWFPSKPEAFGFWLDPIGGASRGAANEISWVTSGTAFLPPDSPFQHGLHRISVTVEGGGQPWAGGAGLAPPDRGGQARQHRVLGGRSGSRGLQLRVV